MTNIAKIAKMTNNKIPELKKEEAKKGPEMSANIAKVTRIFLASEKTPIDDKYRKNNKSNKNQNLQKEKKPGRAPKCPQNVAKKREK